MSHSSVRALIDLTLSFYPDLHNRFPTELHSKLTDIIKRLIDNRSAYPDCVSASLSLTGTSQPIEKLYEILQIPVEPIPSPEISQNSRDGQASRKKSRHWSSYEDARLICGIYRYGINNWATICRFVGNGRTRSQCSQRWQRGLDPKLSKDQWTYAEDVCLLRLVQTCGDKSWTQIAGKMGNRSDVQCRYRYRKMQKDFEGTPGIRKAQSGSLPGHQPMEVRMPEPEMGGTPGFLRGSQSVPALGFKGLGGGEKECDEKKKGGIDLFERGSSSENEELVWD
jgi:hypothetical protein